MTKTVLNSIMNTTIAHYNRSGWRCWSSERISKTEVKLFFTRADRITRNFTQFRREEQ
jgi:hypothetical protein